jgi:hypothetical protein
MLMFLRTACWETRKKMQKTLTQAFFLDKKVPPESSQTSGETRRDKIIFTKAVAQQLREVSGQLFYFFNGQAGQSDNSFHRHFFL